MKRQQSFIGEYMLDKGHLRKIMLDRRNKLSDEEIMVKSQKIMDLFFALEQFSKAKTVMFYVDAKNEVRTKEAIIKALKLNKRVVVPKVYKQKGLKAIEIKGLDELCLGAFDILEPIHDKQVPPKDIDLAVVPGVAFDEDGYRLGYGGGYYDNFLPQLRAGVKKVAIAFNIQVLKGVPREKHDVRMDFITTENGVLRF